MKKNKAETDKTIILLKEVARNYFTEYGFAKVALEEIVKGAGVTRGAVYHHFKNKKGLFLAVFEEIQKEIGQHVEHEAEKSDDSWEQLINGCRAFLEIAVKTENQRILLIDGPAVLGWETFREMDEKYSMSALREQLAFMQEENIISPLSVNVITHCLSGAMNEAILWMADQQDKDNHIKEVMVVIEKMITGLKIR